MTSRNDRYAGLGPLAAWWLPLVGALACAGAVDAQVRTDTPEETVRSLHGGLVAAAREHGGSALEERYRALEPLVSATHDLPYIAQFSIRRQWRDLTAEQRDRFIVAFARLSVMTYASRFGGVSEASFRLDQSSEETADRAQVQAAIARADGTEVPLEYLLQRGPAGWRIINIIADGVSDLALKRAEYQRVLASGSIEDLIRHVEAQTAQLR